MEHPIEQEIPLNKMELENFHVHIEPVKGLVELKLKEIWKFRELLYFFTWRDVKVRYKQTLLGASWAIL